MPLTVKQRLSDGTVVLVDDADGARFVIRVDQYERLQRLPPEEQRAHATRFVDANRTSGDPRTEADRQAMQTAHDAQTGEAHQESDRS